MRQYGCPYNLQWFFSHQVYLFSHSCNVMMWLKHKENLPYSIVVPTARIFHKYWGYDFPYQLHLLSQSCYSLLMCHSDSVKTWDIPVKWLYLSTYDANMASYTSIAWLMDSHTILSWCKCQHPWKKDSPTWDADMAAHIAASHTTDMASHTITQLLYHDILSGWCG